MKMKIAGFAQLRNELSNGNLENWNQCMQAICDVIYIYDQDSDDGSKEYYQKFDNIKVMESETNDFLNEITCKQRLLNRLLKEDGDTSWIFWMDGDTLLENRALDRPILQEFLESQEKSGVDGIKVGHYNLWRSDIHYRIDSNYHDLHKHGVLAFWRNNKKLNFRSQAGLHLNQFPDGIHQVMRSDMSLIHRGFATDHQIIKKYNTYKDRGQSGWDLDRLLDERKLAVQVIGPKLLPDWFHISDDEDPTLKDKIREQYE